MSLLIIGCIGWLIYRVLHRTTLTLSPASLSLMWVLGTGGVYLVYYVFIALFRQNPPSLLILAIGAVGFIDMIRSQHHLTWSGWHVFRQEKWATVGLMLVIVLMSVSIFMSGFYADTTRMWMAKGDMLNQLPEYIPLIESLAEPYHPDYPMMMSHQYQWQLLWGDDLFSLKLSTWVWYITLLLACLSFFTRWTQHPIRWLIVLAGYPAYWFVIPLATVDIPLSVMWVVAVWWILNGLDNPSAPLTSVALVCGTMILTKNEGILMVGCLLIGLAMTWIVDPTHRSKMARLMGLIIVISGMSFLSWYGLIVGQANIAVGSDFGLSGFSGQRVIDVAQLLVPILLDPISTAGLWLIFVGFIIASYRQTPVLWFPVFLYLGIISVSYMFSVRPTTLQQHIGQSYFRLILQIAPMALIYIARSFASEFYNKKQTKYLSE